MPIVEIYTKTNCSFCGRARHLLAQKGIDFREIRIDLGGSDRQAMIQRANGRTTVPQIFIDQLHVGGCDELFVLERSGKLDGLIAA